MNGVHGGFPPLGAPPAAAVWQEHRTADGRVYYYNAATKVTQWTKPEDMMTPAERALANQPWKEYTAEGGRKYWYNTETKQSSWEMPEAYKAALGVPSTPVGPAFSAPAGYNDDRGDGGRDGGGYGHGRGGHGHGHGHGRGHGGLGYDNHRDRDRRESFPESRQLTFGNDNRFQSFIPANNEPEFDTPEEAEAAFVKLLRRSEVEPNWTWEQTLRTIVKDPHYRAIKDPKDRKAAFEQYCHDVVVQDKERQKERLAKLRSDFTAMLKSHPEIKYYTRWKVARPMIEGETVFRSAGDDNERRQFFEDYIRDLKLAHAEEQSALRKSAMDGLIELLPKLNLDPYTRWSDAQGIISATPPFQNDEKYKSLTKFDILTVFQNHIKALERSFNDSRQEQKNKKYRQERKTRDTFAGLLTELRQAGKIKASTKWSQIFPQIENDERYQAILGQGGSTPQDMFFDITEEEERALRSTRNDVEDIIDDKRFEVSPKTTFESFLAVMKDDRRTANLDQDVLSLIFERLLEKRKEKRTDEERLAERKERRALEDLRAYMKHVEPPISVNDTYEKVKPRLQKSEEFQAVQSEDARRGAFEKYLRRLKEKEEDAERDRQRRRERDERVSYRDKDRGERSHRHSGRAARSSRTPELDSYEGDRRKAIAERELNYRKSSMAESLLPDRLDRRSDDRHGHRDHRARSRDRDRERARDRDRSRDRDRDRDRERDRDRDRARDRDSDRPARSRADDGPAGQLDRDRERDRERVRDRDYDRPPRSRRDDGPGHYDRERRDREESRERLYRRREVSSRATDELNYGDEKPSTSATPNAAAPSGSSSVRRRREDEEPDRRDSKRPKREKSRERTPPARESARKGTRTAQPTTQKAPKEDAANIHSGSEEGEIEED